MAQQILASSAVANATKIVGLVAGEGKLPAILARSAQEKGYQVIAYALSEQAEAQVAPFCVKTHIVAPGQLERNCKLMAAEGVREVVFIGKIPKLSLLKNITKFDWWAVRELSKLSNFSDDTIQRAVGDFTARMGMTVLTQADFLRHLYADFGVISKRQPTVAEYADVNFGFKVAKEIARLDIGQTVIVKNQMILAIEAIEGTDEAIRRAVNLENGPVVVVKVAKLNHDPRFDTPTVGMSTMQAMIGKGSGGVLAVEANQTLVVEKDEMRQFADEHDMAVLAV